VRRLIVSLIALVALGLSTASTAQCPVGSGWWVYQTPDGLTNLKFHVKPGGTAVDSLEFTLNAICGTTGTTKSSTSGKAITCEPWGFTWSSSCNTMPPYKDGFDLTVTFTDTQTSTTVLDVKKWINSCASCRALDNSSVVGTEMSTWSLIKALYDF